MPWRPPILYSGRIFVFYSYYALTFVTTHRVPPSQTEICEAYTHRGVVFGAAEEAEKVF